MKKRRLLPLFLLGGSGYVALEMLYRGRSHVSMFAAGGLCFLLVGQLDKQKPRLPQPWRALAGAGIITMVELAAGLLVNRDYGVWDYRAVPLNFHGQICLPFSLAWIAAALGAEQLYRRADQSIS